MGSVVSNLAALFITLPALFYLTVFIIVKQWTNDHRKAIDMAINGTTFILVVSVHFLIIAIWSRSMAGVIILFMLITALLFSILYWKKRDEIIFGKVFKGYWRLSFLLFSFVYLGLLLYGIATRIYGSVWVVS
ncbi:MAG TPA: DUF3397 domain-containing protein [Bacillaceae bacterium]